MEKQERRIEHVILRKELDHILTMPEGSVRWEWFIKQDCYEQNTEEIIGELNKKFIKALHNGSYTGIEYNSSRASKNFDGNCFMEALKRVIEEYKDGEQRFIQKLWKIYTQEYNSQRRSLQLQEDTKGMHWSNVDRLGKLYSRYKKFYKGNALEDEQKKENFIKEMQEKHHYPERLIKEAIYIVDVCDFYEPWSDCNGEEQDVFDKISYNEDQNIQWIPEKVVQTKEEKEEHKKRLIKAEKILRELYTVQANGICDMKKREFMRAFITRDVLKVLKLSIGLNEQGKAEKKCPGYHRYTSMPAGDDEIYELLKQQESLYMNTIFVKDYIDIAIEKKPESIEKLYGIYYNLLKDSFKFTDDQIGNVLKCRKQRISYYGKQYEKLKVELEKRLEELEDEKDVC